MEHATTLNEDESMNPGKSIAGKGVRTHFGILDDLTVEFGDYCSQPKMPYLLTKSR